MDAIRRLHRRSSAAIAALTWALVVGGIACTPEGLGSRTAISEPGPERVDTIDFQEVAASSSDGWRIEAGLAPGIGVCVRSSGFDGLDDDPVCMDKAFPNFAPSR